MGFSMDDYLKECGETRLAEFMLPASHDSGMSIDCISKDHTLLAPPAFTATQSLNIEAQLSRGIRVFDVRPCIKAGEYYCVHWDGVDLIKQYWQYIRPFVSQDFPNQGGFGESIKQIVSSVNNFLDTNLDFVVLNISGWGCVDYERDFNKFNDSQWEGLMLLLKQLRHRLNFRNGDQKKNLWEYKLNELLPNKQSSVAVIMHDDWKDRMGDDYANGFFYSSQWFSKDDSHLYFSEQLPNEVYVGIVVERVLNLGDVAQGALNFASGGMLDRYHKLRDEQPAYRDDYPIVAKAQFTNRERIQLRDLVMSTEPDIKFDEAGFGHVWIKRPVVVIDAVDSALLQQICASLNRLYMAFRQVKRTDLTEKELKEFTEASDAWVRFKVMMAHVDPFVQKLKEQGFLQN